MRDAQAGRAGGLRPRLDEPLQWLVVFAAIAIAHLIRPVGREDAPRLLLVVVDQVQSLRRLI
jgi:hypothetical protein